jgi:leucyl-tRNA synthetase
VKEAVKAAIKEIEKRGLGKGKTNYRLRDAIFGRQRYWGEPIPVYYKDGVAHTLNESELPLLLPEVDKYLPTETGEPPLARAKDWKYKGQYDYEWSTMPGWAGSSWYFLRYMDNKNANEFVNKGAVSYWQNVDLYLGGSEHATGHLLYFRFWTKFLFDIGLVPFYEPAKKLINQGMIQGVSLRGWWFKPIDQDDHRQIFVSFSSEEEMSKRFSNSNNLYASLVAIHIPIEYADNRNRLYRERFRELLEKKYLFLEHANENDVEWEIDENGKEYIVLQPLVEKMSKSKYNVVTPDDIVSEYGADTLRLYEMFLGPLEQSKPWNTQGIEGVHRFLKKLWKLFYSGELFVVTDEEPSKKELKSLHKLIKKVVEDIENFSFNTSVPAFMICVNELTDLKCSKKKVLQDFLVCLSPYAPHIAEELWSQLGNAESITKAQFPSFNAEYLIEDSFSYPISINGKHRANIEMGMDMAQADVEQLVLNDETVQKWLEGKPPKKIIFVKGKIVNLVL